MCSSCPPHHATPPPPPLGFENQARRQRRLPPLALSARNGLQPERLRPPNTPPASRAIVATRSVALCCRCGRCSPQREAPRGQRKEEEGASYPVGPWAARHRSLPAARATTTSGRSNSGSLVLLFTGVVVGESRIAAKSRKRGVCKRELADVKVEPQRAATHHWAAQAGHEADGWRKNALRRAAGGRRSGAGCFGCPPTCRPLTNYTGTVQGCVDARLWHEGWGAPHGRLMLHTLHAEL